MLSTPNFHNQSKMRHRQQHAVKCVTTLVNLHCYSTWDWLRLEFAIYLYFPRFKLAANYDCVSPHGCSILSVSLQTLLGNLDPRWAADLGALTTGHSSTLCFDSDGSRCFKLDLTSSGSCTICQRSLGRNTGFRRKALWIVVAVPHASFCTLLTTGTSVQPRPWENGADTPYCNWLVTSSNWSMLMLIAMVYCLL